MKTVKELQDIFIEGRYGEGTPFYHYCRDLIYKGHTVADRLRLKFKTPENWDGCKDTLPKKLKDLYPEMETFVRKETFGKNTSEVDRRIDSRFEKYRVELNKFLKQ